MHSPYEAMRPSRRSLNERKAKIQAKIKSWSDFDRKQYVYLVRRSQER